MTLAAREPATGGPLTSVRTHPERAVPAEASAILREGIVAHVGFSVAGQTYVIPMTYHFDSAAPDRLYLHGSHASRLIAHLATGAPVSVAVTLVDGLVYSRTAMYHSANYRSVVCFGRAAETPDAATQAALLEAMISRYFPGRVAGRDYEAARPAHLEATGFIALAIEALSAKARRGGPKGPGDADAEAPGSAGVIPFGFR